MKAQFFSVVLAALLAVPSFATDLYMIGDATSAGWNLDQAIQMTESETNVFEWVGDLRIGELKFLTQTDAWIPSYGPVTVDEPMVEGEIALLLRDGDTEGSDHKFKVGACGWYTLIVNLNEEPKITVSVFYPETMFIIGPAVGGWSWDDNAQQMQATDERGVFIWRGNLSEGEMKFFEQKDFISTAYGAREANTAISVDAEFDLEKLGEEDKKFIACEGEMTLVLNLRTMQLITSPNATSLTTVMIDSRCEVYTLTGTMLMQAENDEVVRSLNPGMYIIRRGNNTEKVIVR